jgi:hypothetical protein
VEGTWPFKSPGWSTDAAAAATAAAAAKDEVDEDDRFGDAGIHASNKGRSNGENI